MVYCHLQPAGDNEIKLITCLAEYACTAALLISLDCFDARDRIWRSYSVV